MDYFVSTVVCLPYSVSINQSYSARFNTHSISVNNTGNQKLDWPHLGGTVKEKRRCET